MASLTELLQMILVLANALRGIVESDVISKAIQDLCKHTRCTRYGKGDFGLARDLMNCMFDLYENVQLLLEHANLVRQQDIALYGYVYNREPLSDEDLVKIESRIMAHLNWQCFLLWNEFHKRHLILDNANKGRIPDWEEVKMDEDAGKVLDALLYIIAPINLIYGIAEEINDIYDEVIKFNVDGISHRQLIEHTQEIMRIRNRMYHQLCDHLIETSKYFFDDKVILSICEEGYKDRKPLQVLNYRSSFKPKSVFVEVPYGIIMFNKYGRGEAFGNHNVNG